MLTADLPDWVKLIWLAIRKRQGDNPCAFAHFKTYAKDCGKQPSQGSQAIKMLVRAGWIERQGKKRLRCLIPPQPPTDDAPAGLTCRQPGLTSRQPDIDESAISTKPRKGTQSINPDNSVGSARVRGMPSQSHPPSLATPSGDGAGGIPPSSAHPEPPPDPERFLGDPEVSLVADTEPSPGEALYAGYYGVEALRGLGWHRRNTLRRMTDLDAARATFEQWVGNDNAKHTIGNLYERYAKKLAEREREREQAARAAEVGGGPRVRRRQDPNTVTAADISRNAAIALELLRRTDGF